MSWKPGLLGKDVRSFDGGLADWPDVTVRLLRLPAVQPGAYMGPGVAGADLGYQALDLTRPELLAVARLDASSWIHPGTTSLAG